MMTTLINSHMFNSVIYARYFCLFALELYYDGHDVSFSKYIYLYESIIARTDRMNHAETRDAIVMSLDSTHMTILHYFLVDIIK